MLKASGWGGETGGDWPTEEYLSKQLSPPMFNFVNYLVLFSFFHKYLGLPGLTKCFVNYDCLCPKEGLDFRYFTLTLATFTPTIHDTSQKSLSTKL